MINKNDYGSYEAPEAIVFRVISEYDILQNSPHSNNADEGYDDENPLGEI